MSSPLVVEANEHGITRVFTADLEPGSQTMSSAEAADLLGGSDINANKIEVVTAQSVETLGVAGYLVDGYGVAADEVASRREELDSLSGQIVLVPSSAFGRAQRLEPSAPLSFIGAFSETPPAAHEIMTPAADSEERPARVEAVADNVAEPTKKTPVGLIVIGALILAAILILLF